MATSRDTILNKLRSARQHIAAYDAVTDHLPMMPLADTSQQALASRFIDQAEKIGSSVHRIASESAAIEALLTLIGGDACVLSWSMEHIPLVGFADALQARQIEVAESNDPSVRVGITGVDGALAATGSLILAAGLGKYRLTSLLPPVHVAVLRASQIMPDLESWVATQRQRGLDAFRQTSSVMLISGPSRTADIAMQLTIGMHGPAELHIILVDK